MVHCLTLSYVSSIMLLLVEIYIHFIYLKRILSLLPRHSNLRDVNSFHSAQIKVPTVEVQEKSFQTLSDSALKLFIRLMVTKFGLSLRQGSLHLANACIFAWYLFHQSVCWILRSWNLISFSLQKQIVSHKTVLEIP